MSDKKYLDVGRGKKLPKDGFKLQLNLTKLWELTQGEAKEFITEYTDKSGKVNKQLNIVCFPMKEEWQTEYATHNANVDTWKPEHKEPRNQEQTQPF